MDPLRDHLSRLLDWHDAHADVDAALAHLPQPLRGRTPHGAPHSPWQLLEHIRLTQHDILEFCVNAAYTELTWPDDYWPAQPEPPDGAAWDQAMAAVHRDRAALQALVADQAIDLFAKIPHGNGQTILREILLVADHTAYHVGQLVIVRRLLGDWPVA